VVEDLLDDHEVLGTDNDLDGAAAFAAGFLVDVASSAYFW
jgi:hypothetical protein